MKFIFPIAIVALSYCAVIPYALAGDWRHATFWFCAGTLNLVVTI
jgi:hypothetical protein